MMKNSAQFSAFACAFFYTDYSSKREKQEELIFDCKKRIKQEKIIKKEYQ